MSEALARIAEALGDGSEEEAAAVLRALGAQCGRQRVVREMPRTPLPPPGGSSAIHSEVEWV
ncbi:hypothetical protein FNV68_21915 [Streptomyces sp. S1D4-23]|nr:hypothetical protein FNV61_20840 [Streptomyces sp. RLB3-6]QDO08563.1 hypothetical protein FNV68_21915 [Streptomyces sp. S1D4-23]